MKQIIQLDVNGEVHEISVAAHRTLLEVLRDQLGLFGAKKGCDEGTCGSCTVLVDGRALLSCMTLALDVTGKEVVTIEGLAENGKLHPLQKAFVAHGAVQCGFCTPGMILASKALLDRNPDPSEEQIKKALAGNLCRCTGYVAIVEAVRDVAESTGAAGGRANE